MIATKSVKCQLNQFGVILTVLLVFSSMASATSILTLGTSSGGSTSITDGGLGDLDLTANDTIVFVSAVDDWIVSGSAQTSQFGTVITVDQVQNSATNTGLVSPTTLTLTFSTTDITSAFPLFFVDATSALGGSRLGTNATTGGTITDADLSMMSWIDPSNTLLGMPGSGLIGTISGAPCDSALGTQSYSCGTTSNLFTLSGPYSVTQQITLTHTGLLQIGRSTYTGSTTITQTPVPEPSTFTLSLLGLGLLGVGKRVRKRLQGKS